MSLLVWWQSSSPPVAEPPYLGPHSHCGWYQDWLSPPMALVWWSIPWLQNLFNQIQKSTPTTLSKFLFSSFPTSHPRVYILPRYTETQGNLREQNPGLPSPEPGDDQFYFDVATRILVLFRWAPPRHREDVPNLQTPLILEAIHCRDNIEVLTVFLCYYHLLWHNSE